MERRRDDDVPQLWIEQLRLGELDETRAAEVRRRLGDQLEARLAALEDADEAALAAHPVEPTVRAIHDRALRETAGGGRTRRRRTGRYALAFGVAAATTVLALFLLRGDRGPATTAPATNPLDDLAAADTRLKGIEPALRIYRDEHDDAVQLRDRDVAHAGDRLQLSYRAGGATHGVILSIDGAGQLSLHHPETAGGPTALAADGEVPLPHAFVLDDAPGFERFVFVTADGPLEVDTVVAAARRDDWPDDWQVRTLTLRKEAR